MMGAGKTTIGKKLAKALNVEFSDLDHVIEKNTGVSIPTIFEIEGEKGFRQREEQTLTWLASMPKLIIATGGGAVLSPINRARLAATGLVIYLHAPPELLYSRTKNDKGRPLLQVENPLGRIRSLAERRDPLYREIADIVIETGAGLSNTINCIQNNLESLCRR
jgi:shikimate kinase